MRKSQKIVLSICLAVLVGLGALLPYLGRVIRLYWAKSSALRTINKFTPGQRRILDAVPTAIVLPPTELKPAMLEQLELGDFTLQIPRPTQIDKQKSVVLTYPQYEVRILRPFSTAPLDAVARQLQFQDGFAEFCAAYHTRLSDFDALRDPESVRRFMLLINLRGVTRCREEFTRGDLRGFILDPQPGETLIVVGLFQSSSRTSRGLWFTDHDGASLAHVHEFLSALEIKPTHAREAGTAPSSEE
jgi:hypothetical protein